MIQEHWLQKKYTIESNITDETILKSPLKDSINSQRMRNSFIQSILFKLLLWADIALFTGLLNKGTIYMLHTITNNIAKGMAKYFEIFIML